MATRLDVEQVLSWEGLPDYLDVVVVVAQAFLVQISSAQEVNNPCGQDA